MMTNVIKMSNAEITGDISPEKKIIMSLYWINKKASTTAGCEQFLIKKIVTGTNTYIPTENKLLMLSPNILNEVIENMESQKEVEFEIEKGIEEIKLSVNKNTFSIFATNKVLEMEIAEKLEYEGRKKNPNICLQFPERVGIDDFQSLN